MDNMDIIIKPLKMNSLQLKESIKEINEYLSTCTWMDFTLASIEPTKIIIHGGYDLLLQNVPNIILEFESPSFVSCLCDWTMDEKKPFLKISPLEDTAEKLGISEYITCDPQPDDYCFEMNKITSVRNNIIIARGLKFTINEQ